MCIRDRLSNDGRTRAGRSCWRRVAPATGAALRDQDWAGLLESVPLGDDEGLVSPLGVCESAESQAEALYHSADAKHNEQCESWGAGHNSWQNRQWQNTRGALANSSSAGADKIRAVEQGEAELSAALNLL